MSNRPLKILIVTSIYPIPEDPGPGAFVASQVESLREAGLEVDIHFLDVRRSKWELVRGIRSIRKIAGNYDLIHAHFGYNGIPACLQKEIPVIVSFCGTDIIHPKLSGISRWVARRADACIVKSELLLEKLGHPAVVIPNGVDTNRFRPLPRTDARRRLGLNENQRYAIFLANPSRPEKRFDIAQAALSAARQKIEPLVLFNRPRDEVPSYLNAANLLLLTSDHEGSPNAVKEAMACNLPIVSTDVGDVRQIVGNTHNCAITEQSPEKIAEAIETVLSDGEPSNGRNNITHLSTDTVAASVINVYQSVLAKGGRS